MHLFTDGEKVMFRKREAVIVSRCTHRDYLITTPLYPDEIVLVPCSLIAPVNDPPFDLRAALAALPAQPPKGCPMFFKKPGKLCATTLDVWIGIVSRRHRIGEAEAAAIVRHMVRFGGLISSDDQSPSSQETFNGVEPCSGDAACQLGCSLL